MEFLQTSLQSCPSCGEPIELTLDLSGGDQGYVEDCPVCCAPMVVTVHCPIEAMDAPVVDLRREND